MTELHAAIIAYAILILVLMALALLARGPYEGADPGKEWRELMDDLKRGGRR